MLRKLLVFLLIWAIVATLISALYINRAGISALFRDKRRTFTLTREGLTQSVKEVAKLVVYEVTREYKVKDTVPPIMRGPVELGGRKTIMRFVVNFKLAFDISKIRSQDVTLSFSGDTVKVSALLPEPDVMVSIDRWWVESEEVGILGTPMRSWETSPIFDYLRNEARSRMKEELPTWSSELSSRMEKIMGNLLRSILGRPVIFKVKGFRVTPEKT